MLDGKAMPSKHMQSQLIRSYVLHTASRLGLPKLLFKNYARGHFRWLPDQNQLRMERI